MRHFEYVGGGSEKFWEIAQVGTSVTVCFGRIGTNGQTQVKDLGSAEAADAHVAKLVAEKVKKGYIENGAAAPSTVAAPTAPTQRPAPAVEQPPTPAAAPGAATTGTTEAAAEPDLDEDSWAVPGAWWRQAEPFRGRGPVRSLAVDRAATEVVAELRARADADAEVTRVLDNPASDNELVERARLFLGTPVGLLRRARQEIHPLGAAVAALVLAASTDWQGRERVSASVDDWVIAHGLTFAAEAGALLADLSVPHANYRHAGADAARAVVRDHANELGSYHVQPLLKRLRALIAAADDDAYASVVARLAELRSGPTGRRLLTSYLVPSEQQWVAEDVALIRSRAVSGDKLAPLLASVTTQQQATTVIDATRRWASPEHVYSMAAHIGPDVAPILALLFDEYQDADSRKRLVSMLGQLPTDEAFTLLLDRLAEKYVQPVVLEAMAKFPRRAMRLLAVAGTGSGASATTAKELLRSHAIAHPALVERTSPELTPAAADLLAAVATATATVPVAPPDQLPALLVEPPWTARKTKPKPVVVDCTAPPSATTLVWLPGEQQEWAELESDSTGAHWGHWEGHIAKVIAAGERSPDVLAVLMHAPVKLVRPHLRRLTLANHWWEPRYFQRCLRRILGRFGDDAIQLVLQVACTLPSKLADALLPLEGGELAPRMAEWYARSKSARPAALAWLDRHPAAAARDLVPLAVGKPGKDRSTAEGALRLLDQRGHREIILTAAEAYGPAAVDAVDAVLAMDPLLVLPVRMPALPTWLDPRHLPQVLLPGRASALPVGAVEHICTMLAMSKPGEVYAGIDVVRAAVDPDSLAELGWSLFERWRGAGFPTKDGWILDALGLVGDDETVRRLAPLIRAWPGEAAHARAVAGLSVLSAIGTDVALMHLHGIAEKVKFAGLKAQAKAKMAEVADGLGLTADQLADRLVPDFDLDDDGTMLLDYGGDRRFRVGFDEQLKPIVADEDGARRTVLPKPGAKDDPTRAPAAYARFGALKKDVKTIAADQIRRFERAMVNGRRWTAAEHRTLFVEHPLLWHLARRLVWAAYDERDELVTSFRVAEDRTLAASADNELTLDEDAAVGIAHPLHLGDALGSWSDVFADYEILQPFPQLGREVLQLTDAERTAPLLERFHRIKVPTGKILGLSHRGWERGTPQDGGVTGVTYKPVPGGRAVVIDLDPGIIAGAAMEWPEQTIDGVWLNDGPAEWSEGRGKLSFGLLDPITASEMLRDLESLRS